MWDVSPRAVLVGVASTDGDAALLYAADEARRRRCGVHLVHVAPLAYDGPAQRDAMPVVTDQLHEMEETVLREAAATLERELRDDDLTVSTELCWGAVIPALVAESIHSCLVVVGRRPPGIDGDRTRLSAADGIAARAQAPVVLVPADWQPPRPIRTPVVTVGVKDVTASAEILRTALEHADRVDARLRLVHALNSRGAARGPSSAAADSRTLRRLFTDAFAGLLTAHPEVPVEITVCRGEPADALLRHALDSTLLVVGRPQGRSQLTPHLGLVTRDVLRRSPVPVLVVDPAPDVPPRANSAALAAATIP